MEHVGAERGERTPERLTQRNGYRSRPWQTRAGELELAIPKLRRGSYFPSFLEPRRRSEQALVSLVQEAYVAGVSTRKVDQVVESLGLLGSVTPVSASPAPRLTRRRATVYSLMVSKRHFTMKTGGEDEALGALRIDQRIAGARASRSRRSG